MVSFFSSGYRVDVRLKLPAPGLLKAPSPTNWLGGGRCLDPETSASENREVQAEKAFHLNEASTGKRRA